MKIEKKVGREKKKEREKERERDVHRVQSPSAPYPRHSSKEKIHLLFPLPNKQSFSRMGKRQKQTFPA